MPESHSTRVPGIARRRMAVLMALLACGLLAWPATLPAQSPEQRAALERWRDSLNQISDTIMLLRRERLMITEAKADRDNPIIHLRLGFLALRMGEVGDDNHYDDAASEFEWATQLKPDWPYPWYGLGLAELGVGDSQIALVSGLKTMFGKDALTISAMAFAKSAEVDPSFVHGLVELANTAMRQRVNIRLGVALDAHRRAASTEAAKHPQVLLARGRVEREVGDADSALVAFKEFLARGGNPGIGSLEVARTEFVRGTFDGVLPYFSGASHDDDETVAAYRKDITYIATTEELAAFDAASGSARAEWLRHFWETRDRLDLRRDGERLREHYRRVYYARQNFYLASVNRHYQIEEIYHSGSTDFDDRGVIYIRHGEPSERASYAAPGIEPNETWRYGRPDGDLIFHFVAREDVQDYKLVESLFDVLGYAAAVTLQNSTAAASSTVVTDQLLLSREQLSPMYRRLMTAGGGTSGRYMAEERATGRQSIEVGTTTDSYELDYPKELKARVQVLAVGADAEGSLVQVAYAIPGSSLTAVSTARGQLYPVRLRFVVMDAKDSVIGALDTTRMFVSRSAVPAHEHLVGRAQLHLPPGTHNYRIALQQGEDAGIVYPYDAVRVGGPRSGFGLSDLVLGRRGTNLPWRATPSDTVFLNPLRSFRPDDELQLYYEVFGMMAGATLKTQVTVKKEGGGGLFGLFGGGSAISLRFEDQAPGVVMRVTRGISLEKLKAGNYQIEVTITRPDGRTDVRRQQFTVQPAN
jgi:GWxTD domain-containing protein